jgi:hypothetical protein
MLNVRKVLPQIKNLWVALAKHWQIDTHITTKGLDQINKPFDHLNLD